MTTTSVYTFGANSGLFKYELDGFSNTDQDGKEKTTFLPGDILYFLLIYNAARVEVVSVKDTAGGDIQIIAPVSREKREQITFQHPAHLVDLQYVPNSNPVAEKWYGRGSNLYLDNGRLYADMAPCLGDITYSIIALQGSYQIPSDISVPVGGTFPIDIVIEWREIADANNSSTTAS